MSKGVVMRSIVAALLALVVGAGALAQAPEAEGPHTLVLVVLHPLQKGQKQLEPAEFGGSLKTRAGSRLAVRVPEAAIEALKRDPRVKYVQRVVFGDAPQAGTSSMRMITASSVAQPEVTVNGTGSVTIGPYAYDGSGNVYEIRGTLTGAEHTDTFTYDGAGRLKTAAVHAFDVGRSESYVYDSPGNLIQLHTGGTVIVLPVDASTNRLRSSHGFEYDGVGNMIATPLAGGYQYDHVEMLRATDRHQYIYTADDERLAVTFAGIDADELPWKWTLRDLSKKPVREYESVGSISNEPDFLWKGDHFYGGGTAVAAQRELAEGGLRHFHADHLGTPRLITNSAGGRISTHVYYPFGVEITSVTQERALGYEDEEHIAFTGHERDGLESQEVDHSQYLDYMHARYYNPNWGRFLSVDPKHRYKATSAPQEWNRYSYAINNPIKYFDPDGLAHTFYVVQAFSPTETPGNIPLIEKSLPPGYKVEIMRGAYEQQALEALTKAEPTDYVMLQSHASARGLMFLGANGARLTAEQIAAAADDGTPPSGIILAGCDTSAAAAKVNNDTGILTMGGKGGIGITAQVTAIAAMLKAGLLSGAEPHAATESGNVALEGNECSLSPHGPCNGYFITYTDASGTTAEAPKDVKP